MSQLNLDFRVDYPPQQGKKFSLTAQLDLEANSITGLYGPSGSGKTTLLRAIAGLEPQTKGSITFHQQPWQKPGKKNTPVHQRKVGFVFQDSRLFPHLTVAGNLRFAARYAGGNETKTDEIIEALILSPLLHQFPWQLSAGQAQRVAIGRTLAANPRLLLMDEPMAAMDNTTRQQVAKNLTKLLRQYHLPALFVSHQLRDIALLAKQLIVLRDGKVIAYGMLEDIISTPSLELPYLDDAFSLLHCQLVRHEENYGMSSLQCVVGRDETPCELRVVKLNVPVGTSIRLHIAVKDVSLTLHKPSDTSIVNILPCTVMSIHSHNHYLCLVRLQLGEQVLLSRISHHSAQKLKLQPGTKVFAQIKSTVLSTI